MCFLPSLRVLVAVLVLLLPAGLRGEAPPTFLKPTRLGPARALAAAASLKVGHAELSFTGRWAPLRQEDKVVGLFLVGDGTLDYTSTFEPEWPVFARNLKEWTPLKLVEGGTGRRLRLPFKTARILIGGGQVAQWGGEASGSLEEAYTPFSGWWDQVDGHVPSHLMAVQPASDGKRATAVIELDPGDPSWLYTYDGVDSMEERLQCTHPAGKPRPDLKGWHGLVGLSRQAIGWDPRTGLALPRFVLSGLDIDLRTRDNRSAEVVAKETIVPFEDGIKVLTFDFLSDLVLGKDTRHLTITRLADGEGRSLSFSHTHDQLAVELAAPAKRGVPLTLLVAYNGDFLVQPVEDGFWELGIRAGWYPTPANLTSESYAFHGTVRTTGDWIAFLPGETVRRVKEGPWNLVETLTNRPICSATILGGKYFIDEETQDGLTVRIATYGSRPGSANKPFKAQAFNVIKYYQNFLGAFPFKEFLIIEKKEWGNGQAPPGMMYIAREAYEQAQTTREKEQAFVDAEQYKKWGYQNPEKPDYLETMDVRQVFAHEIAHQWWGTLVKMPSQDEQWLTESFAEFCAALFVRDYKGQIPFDRKVAHWRSEAGAAANKAPIPLASQLWERNAQDRSATRRDLLYAKGPVLLQALHRELGDKLFLTWLKSIQTNFRWKFATTPQLFDVLRFITKKDYTSFCNDYYWGLALPPKKD